MDLNPSVPVTTVPDFIAYARANPGAINIASAGNGTPGHMAVEMFKMMTGLNLVHVPYRGAAPAMTDLLAGQVQVVFDNLPTSLEHIRAGKIRALAVTSAGRSPALPGVPALAEFVPGYEVSSWFGIGAPQETPTEIVALLNSTINAALADPAMQARFAEMASAPIAMTPGQFRQLIAEETEKWAKVMKFAGVSAADR
jgi:tripartite-type tricarboxylate transporter receptor subunit TctC